MNLLELRNSVEIKNFWGSKPVRYKGQNIKFCYSDRDGIYVKVEMLGDWVSNKELTEEYKALEDKAYEAEREGK